VIVFFFDIIEAEDEEDGGAEDAGAACAYRLYQGNALPGYLY
jgi:hypothetical protein